MRYRIRTGKHYRQFERFGAGDVIEPTEAELKAFGDRFEAIADPADTTGKPMVIETVAPLETILGIVHGLKALDSQADMAELPELPGGANQALAEAGITTLEQLAALAMAPEALEKVRGIGKTKARAIREALMAMAVAGEGENG
jgi:hypothetical protein